MGGVGDGDIHRLKRLTATRVVRGDFNVVGVGRTLPTVNIHVGGLVDEGRYLHRLKVARCTGTGKEAASRRVPSGVDVTNGAVECDVDVVGNTRNHVNFKVIEIA